MFSARPHTVGIDLDGQSRAVSLARTPGKGLSSRTRTENLLTGGLNTRGKKHTPAQPNTLQPKRLFKDAGIKPTAVITTVPSRPLLDKTPFPNRTRDPPAFHTPLPHTKITFLEPELDGTPLFFPRASSTRKHIRVPRSASRSFETPPNRTVNPWDVSELDICLTHEQSSIVEDAVAEEDYDEIEYMPARPTELPYCPPFDFDLPNYKELGAKLLELARSYPIDDSVPSPLDAEYEADFLTCPAEWSPPLPDLVSDSDNDSRTQKRQPMRINARSASRIPASVTRKVMTKSTAPPLRTRIQPPNTRAQFARATSSRVPSGTTSPSRTGAGSASRTRATTFAVTGTSAGSVKWIAGQRDVRGVSGAKTTPVAGTTVRATRTVGVSQRSLSVTSQRRPATSTSLNRGGTTMGKGNDEILLKVPVSRTVGEEFLFSV